jgi:hypothetical protein
MLKAQLEVSQNDGEVDEDITFPTYLPVISDSPLLRVKTQPGLVWL